MNLTKSILQTATAIRSGSKTDRYCRLGDLLYHSIAKAASYGSFSDEQKLLAEAWRLVDITSLDRTFSGQDWFQLSKQTKVQ